MKITVRNLQQQTFQVEVSPADKISTVKEAVEKEKGYPVAQQKLIFSGKILEDAASVEDCKIGEKDFVVVMVAKPKPVASASSVAAAPPAAPQPKEESTSPAAPAAAPPTPVPNVQPAAAPTVQPTHESPSIFSSGFVVGSEYNSAVANMVEMGFPREQVMKAMRASFNNPDRAVEYLMTGIPEHLERETSAAPSAAAQTSDSTRATTTSASETPIAPGAGAPGGPINLFEAAAQAAQQQEHEQQRNRSGAMGSAGQDISFLANQPQFQQLRALVRSNPALLEPLLQQLGQANPQLLALINQNQQAFMRMLQDDMGGEGEEEAPGGGAQYVSVNVTPEEREALERLEGLGFERNLVLEAFLACDKNEELAANYLLNMSFEDDDQ